MSSLGWDNSDFWYPHTCVFPGDAQSLVAFLELILRYSPFGKLDTQVSGLSVQCYFGSLMLLKNA